MSLCVKRPGMLSLLVDAGRPRSRALGVPVGGAADRAALAIGNALVGNAPDAAALELTLAGPTLVAEHPTAAVVFGAPFAVLARGTIITPGTTFQLEPGDTLTIGATPAGARGYLCVAGGFDGPLVLGSRSALDPLTADAVLPCRPSRGEPRGLGFAALPDAEPYTLRALPGPQRDWFAADAFFGREYTVTPASNRMGVRLAGEPLTRRPGELVSEAVGPGAVQVANDGLPIVLGVDGQTIGGYPKVAHVIRADLDRLAQLRPGDRVRFRLVTWEEAEAAARERAAAVRAWLVRLRAADRAPVCGY
ncbi:5-oxoprolinase subunit C family protein [Urbifossiella limnaea]|uniref:KipI antagonist n=1 Tax=Urbifossiella limnaea TaxID=2528023 RepID=A0A517XLM6_9BACT|nr:biotin-dependent carboxyltransferase family protein [Urbifossiella limnaea]QDU18417.1 KipI antagonist [Urbifossiella limnaea]